MRKSRAVLLGTNAYPFLMRYWYEIFTKRWQDEVDKVYIAVSQPEHKSVWPYIRTLLSSHPKIEVIECNTNWPASINTVVRTIKEDILWVPHDDTFILKSGALDKYFSLVEDDPNVVVTPLTPIFTPKDTIEELMRHRFPDQTPFVAEDGTTGYSWYCNMFFVSRELLEKTSMDFGEWHVNLNEWEPVLNWVPMASKWGADTNFKMTLELLKAGAKVHVLPRYEIAHLYNEKNPISAVKAMVDNKVGAFSDEADYVHLQTMAYHIYGFYFDIGYREMLERTTGGKVNHLIVNRKAEVGVHAFTWDFTMKLAWLKEFMSVGDYSGMQRYYDHAERELQYIIGFAKLNVKHIDYFREIFHNLIWKKEIDAKNEEIKSENLIS